MKIGRILGMCALLVLFCACDKGKTFDERIAHANGLIANSDFGSAIVELKSALLQDRQSAEARWLLGKVYFDSGDAASAEKELIRAIELGWTADDAIPILAASLLAQGKNNEVLELAETGMSSHAAASLLAAKALSAKELGESHNAITLINQALDKSPESTAALLAKTLILVGEGDFSGAEIELEKVMPQEPNNGFAWSLMGDIRIGQKKPRAALEAYDNAIALQQNDHATLLKRALLNVQLEDYGAAQADTKKLLRRNPQQPGANYVQGLIHFQTERYDEATTPLWVARSELKRYPLVLFFLSSTQLMKGNLDQAAVQALRYQKMIPDSIRGRKLLSFIRLEQGRYEDVLELLAPVLYDNPDNVDALVLMSNAMLRDGQVDEGITLLARVAAQVQGTSISQVTMGAGRLLAGDSDDAAEYIETTLDLDPELQQVDILGVMRYVSQQDYQAAISAAQAYQARDPVSTTALNLLGRVYQSAGQQEKARESFKKALQLDIGNPAANHNLAQMAIVSEDMSAARKHYTTILDYDDDNLSALIQLALLDDKEEKKESFVWHLKKATWAHESALEPRLMLGRYHLREGRPENVVLQFKNLGQVQQQLPQVVRLKGLAKLAIEALAQDRADLDLQTRERRLIDYWVRRLAPEYGLDPELIMAVIEIESNFNPGARSPANALGLMQLIPATAARFGVRDRADPVQNLHGGMAYLRWLLSFFDGDLRLSLAGYNAGEGAVVKYLGIPPYPETQNYVRKVTRVYGRSRHPPIEPVVKPTRFMPSIRAKQFGQIL
jgi:putative PEP-CTERM system TPR-repeat lipoprotein